ncbi:E3 ubiquitin- ligase DZIP3, partial [Paramuricea clavata]
AYERLQVRVSAQIELKGESPPFDKVGVDFAGPLYVKQGKSMRKVYIALFSCCVTRALHLELVEDLSAQTFRRCLRRFTAARGNPSIIVSDNAKTFKAVEKTLKHLFDHPEVKSDLEVRRIEWKFNLERAPWWGGFFERMVRNVKVCLRK